MAKATLALLFVLSLVATLLLGINIGKKMEKLQSMPIPSPTPQNLQISPPSVSTTPPITPNNVTTSGNLTTYTSYNCFYKATYPNSWRHVELDAKSVAFENPSSTESGRVAILCAQSVPTPSVPVDKIANYSIGSISAKLYHNFSSDSTPLEEIIAPIPGKNMNIFIAGSGSVFSSIVKSIQFLP